MLLMSRCQRAAWKTHKQIMPGTSSKRGLRLEEREIGDSQREGVDVGERKCGRFEEIDKPTLWEIKFDAAGRRTKTQRMIRPAKNRNNAQPEFPNRAKRGLSAVVDLSSSVRPRLLENG
jgi:hypothetical protein